MAKPIVDAAQVRELLNYDPETGVWVNRTKRRPQSPAGSIAGGVGANGYRYIALNGRRYLAHRLAWFYVHGVWPVAEIDHRNTKRDDNRLENLREATRSLNCQNQCVPQKKGTSGYLGVTWDRRKGKWQAQIKANSARNWLGYFDAPEAAHEAYVEAKRRLHAGCTI